MNMNQEASLLIIEQVVEPPQVASGYSTLLEIAMLVLLGGNEPTRNEFAALLTAADLEPCTVTPTPTTFTIINARPISHD